MLRRRRTTGGLAGLGGIAEEGEEVDLTELADTLETVTISSGIARTINDESMAKRKAFQEAIRYMDAPVLVSCDRRLARLTLVI